MHTGRQAPFRALVGFVLLSWTATLSAQRSAAAVNCTALDDTFRETFVWACLGVSVVCGVVIPFVAPLLGGRWWWAVSTWKRHLISTFAGLLVFGVFFVVLPALAHGDYLPGPVGMFALFGVDAAYADCELANSAGILFGLGASSVPLIANVWLMSLFTLGSFLTIGLLGWLVSWLVAHKVRRFA